VLAVRGCVADALYAPVPLRAHALEHLRRLVERQPHDAGEAAAQGGEELRGAPLDGVRAGLVVAFAGGDILPDVFRREDLELDLRDRNGALELRFGPEADGPQ